MEFPGELFADRVDALDVAVGGKLIDALSPQREREADEEDGFNEYDAELDMRGSLALHAVITRLRVPGLMEAEDGVKEVRVQPTKRAAMNQWQASSMWSMTAPCSDALGRSPPHSFKMASGSCIVRRVARSKSGEKVR